MSLDRMFYLVVSDHQEGPIIFEIELARMDFATVAKDILHGQYNDVLHVIEFNPVEHICREVTRDFRALIEKEGDRGT